MKTPLAKRIVRWLEANPGWHNGGEIERLAESVGYKGGTASRICRALYVDGKIDRKEEKSVYYKTLN